MMANGGSPMTMPMTRGSGNNMATQQQPYYDNQMNRRPYSNQMMMNGYPMMPMNRGTRGAGWRASNQDDSMENTPASDGQMTDMMMRDPMNRQYMGNNRQYPYYNYNNDQMMYANGY